MTIELATFNCYANGAFTLQSMIVSLVEDTKVSKKLTPEPSLKSNFHSESLLELRVNGTASPDVYLISTTDILVNLTFSVPYAPVNCVVVDIGVDAIPAVVISTVIFGSV